MKRSKERSKSNSSVVNPHDAFFKAVFTRREVALDFFQQYLPSSVAEQIDLDSLEYQKDSFVDRELREFYSDLLFKVDLRDKSTAYLYILLEHKSYQEKTTAYQLLRYIVKIWETAQKDEESSNFPVVVPVLFYHGEYRWRHGAHLRELVSYPDDLQRFLPDFEYVLWDASAYNDEEIRGTVMLQVSLLLFRYIFREDLRNRLPGILVLFREFAQKRKGRDFLDTVIRYLLAAAPKENLSPEDIKKTVKTIPQIGGNVMMTIADTYIEEGIEIGILKNAKEDVLETLEIRFSAVPQALARTVEQVQDMPILKILFRKAIQAESLEAFERLAYEILR
ncbi:MAG: Rpn family recombination-promoting nuclease/putative transposase [bacterium]|nr:Rpn family recombination-promoting nuclease/putative transposase [bacterium]